jgi:hypothetical protein
MTISLIVEIALSGLLLATLAYCAVLERRLAALRSGQDGLKQTVVELNTAIVAAGASLQSLKSSAAGAAEILDERIARARGMIDELSLLAASGERIAERIASAPRPAAAMNGVTPAVLASRLEALKPDAMRNVR